MAAYKGLGTNETELISTLAHRNEAQRKLVRLAYEEIYHQDLIQQLKSELSGNFEVKKNITIHSTTCTIKYFGYIF